VRFAGLPGGHYVFEVTAAGPNGLWSPTPARFRVFNQAAVVANLVVHHALRSCGAGHWSGVVAAAGARADGAEGVAGAAGAERTAELVDSHRQLEEIAYHDMLTSLPNRRMFTEQFRMRLAIARRKRESFGILLIDLDHFKRINDAFGHDAGDAVLIETAKRLQAALRESDCPARLGGDEFGVLLVSARDRAGIEAVCKRIVDSFAVHIPFKGMELYARCSIGAAVFPDDGDNPEVLYKSADMALYESKRAQQEVFYSISRNGVEGVGEASAPGLKPA